MFRPDDVPLEPKRADALAERCAVADQRRRALDRAAVPRSASLRPPRPPNRAATQPEVVCRQPDRRLFCEE